MMCKWTLSRSLYFINIERLLGNNLLIKELMVGDVNIQMPGSPVRLNIYGTIYY